MRPHEVEFLARVARGVVGRHGLEMLFELVEGVEPGRCIVWAGHAYGHHVDYEITIVGAALALVPATGRPIIPSDVVEMLRSRLRTLCRAGSRAV